MYDHSDPGVQIQKVGGIEGVLLKQKGFFRRIGCDWGGVYVVVGGTVL